jgi:hypothetical protein
VLLLQFQLFCLIIIDHAGHLWTFENLGMFCYNLHPAQPEEDWTPHIAWFLSRFLPRFWPSHCASTPALLAVWGFRLGFCTALWDISWCTGGYINKFDLRHPSRSVFLSHNIVVHKHTHSLTLWGHTIQSLSKSYFP